MIKKVFFDIFNAKKFMLWFGLFISAIYFIQLIIHTISYSLQIYPEIATDILFTFLVTIPLVVLSFITYGVLKNIDYKSTHFLSYDFILKYLFIITFLFGFRNISDSVGYYMAALQGIFLIVLLIILLSLYKRYYNEESLSKHEMLYRLFAVIILLVSILAFQSFYQIYFVEVQGIYYPLAFMLEVDAANYLISYFIFFVQLSIGILSFLVLYFPGMRKGILTLGILNIVLSLLYVLIPEAILYDYFSYYDIYYYISIAPFVSSQFVLHIGVGMIIIHALMYAKTKKEKPIKVEKEDSLKVIEKLFELKQKGYITETEFEELKKKELDKLIGE